MEIAFDTLRMFLTVHPDADLDAACEAAHDQVLATLRTVEQERDAWHRRWLDETATSEQFERERDDARAALRLMQGGERD